MRILSLACGLIVGTTPAVMPWAMTSDCVAHEAMAAHHCGHGAPASHHHGAAAPCCDVCLSACGVQVNIASTATQQLPAPEPSRIPAPRVVVIPKSPLTAFRLPFSIGPPASFAV